MSCGILLFFEILAKEEGKKKKCDKYGCKSSFHKELVLAVFLIRT
jgi:hypothetical protein